MRTEGAGAEDAVRTEDPGAAATPALRVISGNATAEEVAAIVAVLTAAGSGTDDTPPARRSWWAESTRVPGYRPTPGPGAWRASAFPR